MSSFQDKPIETIRLDDREKRRVVESYASPKSLSSHLPRNVRVAYDSTCVTVSIANPGGNVVRYSVLPRNLSRWGIAFLHGRFVYPDRPCQITLQTLDREVVTVEGKIVRCNHLGGTIHDVAAMFEGPIDLTHFTRLTPDELAVHSQEHEKDPAEGHVPGPDKGTPSILIVDGYRPDRKLFGVHLRREGYVCHSAVDGAEALALADGKGFGLAIVDVCLQPEYGLDLLGPLSTAADCGPVLAVSSDDDEATRSAVLAAGATDFVAKPFAGSDLIGRVNALILRPAPTSTSPDAIVSEFVADPLVRPLLSEFVKAARVSASELGKAHTCDDRDAMRQLCKQLKGAGAGYGFGVVTELAGDLIDVLDAAEDDLNHYQTSVDKLLDVLGRIRAG